MSSEIKRTDYARWIIDESSMFNSTLMPTRARSLEDELRQLLNERNVELSKLKETIKSLNVTIAEKNEHILLLEAGIDELEGDLKNVSTAS